ncbi:hypothetical protein F0562_033788 [Nyssa sinensis]|uniref:Uncharacterized protein n=1 Tax=Nyssa sinensis TaxID=561372 RepID=A0A5J5AEJ2_9ASTE|nr:hypothetical protein F0562_033788 [Nyssa sinensis]
MAEMIIRLQVFPQTLSHHSSPKPSKNPSLNSKPHLQVINGVTPLHSRTPLASQLTTSAPPPTAGSGLRFREKLLYLQTLKVNPTKALEKNPNIRSTPLASLKSVEKCLSSMGIERSAFGRIFDMHPQLLTCDPYADLYPLFEFLLNDVNIPFPDIRKSIIRCPRLANLQRGRSIETHIVFLAGIRVCRTARDYMPDNIVIGLERGRHSCA